jgi:hypothetical protein
VIVTGASPATRAVLELTQTIPVVFVEVTNETGYGVTGSLARPETNSTGITNLYLAIGARWLEILKEALKVRDRPNPRPPHQGGNCRPSPDAARGAGLGRPSQTERHAAGEVRRERCADAVAPPWRPTSARAECQLVSTIVALIAWGAY